MLLFFKDKIIKNSLIVSLILNVLTWLLFYFRIPIQVEPIALRYNVYVGINMIGPWFAVFYFSTVGLLIILINFFIAKHIYKRDKLPAHFLAVSALVCQLILLVYGVLLVMINA